MANLADEEAHMDGATATFKNGVLEVAVPMAKMPAVEETRTVAVTPG